VASTNLEESMATAIDETKLNEFLGHIVGDAGAAMSGALVVVGDRLGLYRAMAAGGPATAAEVARRSGTTERYVQEWLDANAAGGYVTYDPATRRYTLPPEQAAVLADDSSPAFAPGLFQVIQACWAAVPRMETRFRSGEGLAWGEQDTCLFEGTERFFRSGYVGNLLSSWIPALDGVKASLEAGIAVADVGCGHGASTILMAQAFPSSTFVGFDSHAGSIETARRRARAAGLDGRIRFEIARSTEFPGTGYGLVAVFDALHDMEDPAGCARQIRRSLADDGTWLIVEPHAGDAPEQNHNGVGRVFYSASTMFCVPHSLSQRGPALGAQAGEARLRKIVTGAGFTRFRRATETPFNLVLEAKP
jgi:SAM-dependent methyltransferase